MPPKVNSVRQVAGQGKGSVGKGQASTPTTPAKTTPKGLRRPGQG